MTKTKYFALIKARGISTPEVQFAKWEDIQDKVLGFSGAIYKSFSSEAEARHYIVSNSSTPVEEEESHRTKRQKIDPFVVSSTTSAACPIVLSTSPPVGISPSLSHPPVTPPVIIDLTLNSDEDDNETVDQNEVDTEPQ